MKNFSRRGFLLITGGAGLAGLFGCAPVQKQPETAQAAQSAFEWTELEQARISQQRPDFDVVVQKGSECAVLRQKARPVPADLDLSEVEKRMKKTMEKAGGVGIAGPQVGLGIQVAVLMLDYKSPAPRTIFVRNPVIIERSDEVEIGYEGCLSVPGVGGQVYRNRWIRVEYINENGEKVTEEAEGYNAVLWQHELDHLEGILYVDKLQGELLPMEEVRRLRKEMEEKKKAATAENPSDTAEEPDKPASD